MNEHRNLRGPASGNRTARTLTVLPAAILLLFLLLCGAAAAEERHTILLSCSGGSYVGWDKQSESDAVLAPETQVKAADGTVWTLEQIAGLPDLKLHGAALRFSVKELRGTDLKYSLIGGKSRSVMLPAHLGYNLWDVTETVGSWLEDPGSALKVVPMFRLMNMGMKIRGNTVFLQLTFSSSQKLPRFPLDRVSESGIYENSLCMLDAGNPFLARYDDAADSLLTANLELGVPYYYAGGSEEKFLRRFYPGTPTGYYRPEHMYLCGLDCVGMTHLIYEKCGLDRHPSISDLLFTGAGSEALYGRDPGDWPTLLLPGDLIAVKHGTFHILMYLGTMRQFGWTERTAGEAADLLDAPLVIHCGGNPFYYDRYQQFIRDMRYRNTFPPDGGVTVAVIRQTDGDAPHSTESAWGKTYGWYSVDNYPLLVFPLDDCTEMAWYSPDRSQMK